MARDPSLLTSTAPTAVVPATVLIGHVQLRDLIICPRERGVVNYIRHHSIVEHNLNVPDSAPRPLANLSFVPNTLCSLPIDGTEDTLLAAGGQEAEIHLSYHSPLSARYRQSAAVWHTEIQTIGSINNSVLLTSMSLTRSNESSVEPRIGISNNDCTVKFYNVPIRGPMKRNIDEVGSLRLPVPVNHSSISPDGRTLLSVGDSANVYLHRMTGGARITFSPIATLELPSPTGSPMGYSPPSTLTASFSTAFSSDGSKFAVAAEEGLVAVWDVRSSKPMKVFQTEKSRAPATAGNGGASGWLVDETFDWTAVSFRAPGWSVRNVKFGGSGDREIMTFTEHTSLLHVVDARTFETEEIVQVPTVRERTASTPPGPPPPQARPFPYSPPSSISDSTWRALRMSDPSGSTSSGSAPAAATTDAEYSDILVIPPFGDPNIDSDVHALLGSHGIRTRQQPLAEATTTDAGEEEEEGEGEEGDEDHNTGSTHAVYAHTPAPRATTSTYATVNSRRRPPQQRDADEIEVDELESDCLSSRAPSRSSSPSPSTHVPAAAGARARARVPGPGPGPGAGEQQVVYVEDLDVAGTCFDPSGRYVYVASTESVAEWSVSFA